MSALDLGNSREGLIIIFEGAIIIFLKTQDVASGNPGTAYQRLLNLSSHLMAKGEDALAKIAMNEADYIKSHNNFSPTGKKHLKYGTMRLLLPDKT